MKNDNKGKKKKKKQKSSSIKCKAPSKTSVLEALQSALSIRYDALLEYLQQYLPQKSISLKKALHPKHCTQAPDELEVTMNIDDATAFVQEKKEELLSTISQNIHAAVEALLEPKQQNAILGRNELTDQWPWPQSLEAGKVLNVLIACCEVLPEQELLWGWPGEISPIEMLSWAKEPLTRSLKEQFKELMREAKRGSFPSFLQLISPRGKSLQVSFAGVALVYRAKESLENGLKRPVIAVDASKEHHRLLNKWRDLPKGRERIQRPRQDGRLLLFAPKQGEKPDVQMAMPIPEDGLQTTTLHSLRRLMKWEGLRHWAALLSQFSVEGGRRGWIRWTLDGHLKALGYKERSLYDAKLREHIAHQVELLTQLELALYNKDGTLRARQPFLHVGTKYERFEGSEWKLDGMELQINPMLYQGVRNNETGELGRMWYPVPVEVAQIDHSKFPHAITLALILSSRFRWDLDKKQRDHLPISGKKLLEAANIQQDSKHPERAWTSLKINLEELQRVGQLGRIEWDGKPYSNRGICHLRSSDWILDRVKYGLTPKEKLSPSLPLTGKEFLLWRKKQELTQLEAAELLEVGIRTIRRAEVSHSAKITKKMYNALELWNKSKKQLNK